MAAYIIAQIEVTDPTKYDAYRKLVPAALTKYHGRFVVRGGEIVALEGGWQPPRVVVLEFPNLELAREFYHSQEYGQAKQAREGAARAQILAVQGV